MFLFGMKTMSDGIQKSAGDRMRKTLNFMTVNRVAGVLTGFSVTGIIQSSHAVTFMVISFVNAGLLTLKQSIGVIMGSNIGTTVTAWIITLVGFNLNIQEIAWPAIGFGFALSIMKWNKKGIGEFLLGFGFLFLGLHFLTTEMNNNSELITNSLEGIAVFKDTGFVGILIGAGAGMIICMLLHSSSATTAIVLTMAFSNIITFEMAAGMILGANIGATIDAALASIGTKTAAKRAALVHVLFNVIGTLWALPLLFQLIKLVSFIVPGDPHIVLSAGENPAIMTHLAMLHTVFNGINTIIFLPFVNQFAKLVTFIIKDKEIKDSGTYKFADYSPAAPELSIVRVEKEIRDMAGIVSMMYTNFSDLLRGLNEINNKGDAAEKLCEVLKQKEEYIDEMRDTLTSVLIEITKDQLNSRTGLRATRMMRVIGYMEEMSDECYGISKLLEKSIRKDFVFDNENIDALVPYLNQFGEFFSFLKKQLGQRPAAEFAVQAVEYEENINKSRKKLQKLGRKRIEAGGNVKKELFFIELVNRIEKLGDCCMSITLTITN